MFDVAYTHVKHESSIHHFSKNCEANGRAVLFGEYMSDTDDCCIAIGLALALKKKRKIRNKRVWMKEWLQKRSEFTHEHLLYELRLSSPTDFRNFLRMDEDSYETPLKMITPKILKKDTQMRDSIPVSQRLSITLRFLATDNTFADLKFLSAISEQSIGRIVNETCEAIIEVLNDQIKMPTIKEEWKQIADDFFYRWNFPNCVGALDGKHVAIRKPPDSGSFYFNYKKIFSIVLMAVVNANYEFIMVDIGVNGRISDGGVLSHTKFGKALFENALNLPDPSLLPMSDKKLSYIFVGDDAFQLSDHLMKPYSQVGLTEQQRIFNYRLSRARRIVENASGILVSRFGVLQRTVALSPEKVQTVVLACCYLHNLLRAKASKQYFPSGSVDQELLHIGTIIQGAWRSESEITSLENTSTSSKLIRDTFCDYFNNEGQVSWQNKFIIGQ